MTSTRKGLRILQDHLPMPDDGSIVCAKCGEPAPCPAVAGVITDWRRQRPYWERRAKYSVLAAIGLNLWFAYLDSPPAAAHGALIGMCALVYGWMWERYG